MSQNKSPKLKYNRHLWFTYGPSVDDEQLLQQALHAGANGCRLTFSYGTCELQERRAIHLKSIADRISRPCLVVADLAGEKVRLGNFDQTHIEINAGEKIAFCPPGIQSEISSKRFSLTSQRLFSQTQTGEIIIIGDGALSLKVITVEPQRIEAIALENGIINPNRGVSVQGSRFCPGCLTKKDIDDLRFIARSPFFDALALSFVSDHTCVAQAREILHSFQRSVLIIAKIETPQGIDNLQQIVEEADLVMAARGDMALTTDWIELPAAMNRIQQVASRMNKPWLVASQVAEGMERFVFPTRAEICDLAAWMTRGASGVLLSYETAFGKRPIEAIQAIARIMERWG